MQMHSLAQIFITIQEASHKVDEIAGQIIDAIRDAQADTLDDFNEMVDDAYAANGWSRQVGRPSEESQLSPAPRTVQSYVSTIRTAYRQGHNVLEFENLFELRKAVRGSRQPSQSPETKSPELKGISIKRVNKMTGALWHDLVVVWEHLPEQDRETLEEKLYRLLGQFSKKAADLKAAA
jgi:hypothetical protein